jgi:hypothetical protein
LLSSFLLSSFLFCFVSSLWLSSLAFSLSFSSDFF